MNKLHPSVIAVASIVITASATFGVNAATRSPLTTLFAFNQPASAITFTSQLGPAECHMSSSSPCAYGRAIICIGFCKDIFCKIKTCVRKKNRAGHFCLIDQATLSHFTNNAMPIPANSQKAGISVTDHRHIRPENHHANQSHA